MSSAGHILDMINRMKQNKSLRNRRKFKEDNRENSYSEKFETPTEYDFPVVSEAELERIKAEIQAAAYKNNRASFYIFIISIALVAIAIWFFIQYYKVDGSY